MEKISYLDVPAYLRQGFVLVIGEDRTIVRRQGTKIFLYNAHWHSKVKEKDFLELYQDSHFFLYTEQEEVSEQQDEAYYRWRETLFIERKRIRIKGDRDRRGYGN